MKKAFLLVLIVLIVFIASCKPAAQAPPKDAMQKPAATSDAAVDAVGSDINNVDSVEKELSTNELSDLDSGLSDVENI